MLLQQGFMRGFGFNKMALKFTNLTKCALIVIVLVKSKFVCKFLQALKSLGCSHINLADCCSLQLGRDITFHHFFVALVRKDSLACLSLFVQLHQR